MSAWTTRDIPSQRGKLAVVTGANSGLGYETALALAQAGGEVILAARSASKGQDALAQIRKLSPQANVRLELLDLASLASVADFSKRLLAEDRPLDLLINNAGVMALATRQSTADGFEMQFGTNYLGHYALTAHLLPLLRRASAPRVVSLSSIAHQQGRIDFDDLQGERLYRPWKAYSQSKLAMLMFALELQRRSDAQGWGLMSNAAHPGYARTELIPNGPGGRGWFWKFSTLMQPLISHSAAAGALPTLYAATSPDARASGYYGPNGFQGLKGPPAPAKAMRKAHDAAVAARLWDVSAQLTGVVFKAA
jgi:NAD(P)-dependent dehydrogenase (short-subunit alcohol dehydrogenase family)